MRCLTMLFLLALVASGQVSWFVDGSAAGPGAGTSSAPFPTIQQAIGAAAATDTIHVAPGVYVEQIDFLGKDVRVVSIQGAETTTLDGGGVGPVVSFVTNEGAGALLQGFTVTGGAGEPAGGIAIAGTSPRVRDCVITGNAPGTTQSLFFLVDHGTGGVFVDGGAPIFEGCVIAGNTGAVSVGNSGNPVGASGSFHAGGLSARNATLTLEDCVIRDNDTLPSVIFNHVIAPPLGVCGGALLRNCALAIERCTFTGNHALDEGGAGALSVASCSGTIDRTRFFGNTGGAGRSGAHGTNGSNGLFGLCAVAPTSGWPGGNGGPGGLRVVSSPNLRLRGAEIAGNQGGSGGPGGSAGAPAFGCPSTASGGDGGDGAAGGLEIEGAVGSLASLTVSGNLGGLAGAGGGGSPAGAGGSPGSAGVRGSTGASWVNSVIWANVGAPDALLGTFRHCNAPVMLAGTANQSMDPLFVDAAAGDWRLQRASPCRNVGDDTDPDLLESDWEGDPRRFDGPVDMGADEWASRLSFEQPAPGAPVTVLMSQVVPGHEYLNLFSLTPCGTGQASVPMIGLCSTIPDLIAQALLPLGTEPFRIVANAPTRILGPFFVPSGFHLEAVLIDVTGAVFDPTRVSSAARIDVK